MSLDRLAQLLWEAGIPVSYIEGDVTTPVVVYGPSATAQQIADGDAIVAAFPQTLMDDAAAAATAAANETTLRQQAENAFANLRAYRDAASPTNAQTVACVKLLCSCFIALARLYLRKLDATD